MYYSYEGGAILIHRVLFLCCCGVVFLCFCVFGARKFVSKIREGVMNWVGRAYLPNQWWNNDKLNIARKLLQIGRETSIK